MGSGLVSRVELSAIAPGQKPAPHRESSSSVRGGGELRDRTVQHQKTISQEKILHYACENIFELTGSKHKLLIVININGFFTIGRIGNERKNKVQRHSVDVYQTKRVIG